MKNLTKDNLNINNDYLKNNKKYINETSAGIIVYYDFEDKRKYLLLHYEEGHWDLPKGHVENQEKLEETAIRETFEETGLNVNIIKGFKEKISYFFKDKYNNFRLVNKEVYFFLGKANKTEIKLSHEHIGYEWLDFQESMKKLTYTNTKKILVKANEFLNKYYK